MGRREANACCAIEPPAEGNTRAALGHHDPEAIMITNKAIPPLRQRRSAIRTTAIALCVGLTAIGYGVARIAEPPLSSSHGALALAAEGRAMNPGTGSRAADDLWGTPPDASCSGGSEGGADATGNQCNDPGSAISYTPDGATRTVERLRGAAALASGGGPEPVAVRLAAAADRRADPPAPRGTSTSRATNATNAAVAAAACSGGADGGMDATGNQCNP
jgi:hypothetical protein